MTAMTAAATLSCARRRLRLVQGVHEGARQELLLRLRHPAGGEAERDLRRLRLQRLCRRHRRRTRPTAPNRSGSSPRRASACTPATTGEREGALFTALGWRLRPLPRPGRILRGARQRRRDGLHHQPLRDLGRALPVLLPRRLDGGPHLHVRLRHEAPTRAPASTPSTWASALQIVNIMRDVKEDAARGRVYFPPDDSPRYGLTAEDILACRYDARFAALMRQQGARAHDVLPQRPAAAAAARPALAHVRERPAGCVRGDPARIEARHYDVLTERVSLSTREKLTSIGKLWAAGGAGAPASEASRILGAGSGRARAPAARLGRPRATRSRSSNGGPWAGGKTYSFAERETGEPGRQRPAHLHALHDRIRRLPATARHARTSCAGSSACACRSSTRTAGAPTSAARAAARRCTSRRRSSRYRAPRALRQAAHRAARSCAMRRMRERRRAPLDGRVVRRLAAAHGQTRDRHPRFWDFIVVPALNCRSDDASAAQALFVFQEGSSSRATSRGRRRARRRAERSCTSTRRVRYIEERGGERAHRRRGVEAIEIDGGACVGRATRGRRAHRGSTRTSARCRLADAADAAAGARSRRERRSRPGALRDRRRSSTCISGSTGPSRDFAFAAFIGSDMQWVFNRGVHRRRPATGTSTSWSR